MSTPGQDAPGSSAHGLAAGEPDDGMTVLDVALVAAEKARLLILGPLVAGLMALGISYLVPKTYTARTTFLPPQQQQSAAVSALASLGALAALAGGSGTFKSPADQYVSLLTSTTLRDRLIEQYDLKAVYEVRFRFEAREALNENVRVSLGRKDGIISVEVDDKDPQRAADMANSHVEELRRLTDLLAVTEAQQRRVFFEQQLQRSKERLTAAQLALRASGFDPGALKAEPRAAAEQYARTKAELAAAEIRAQSMRSFLADGAPELERQLSVVSGLRRELAKLEQAAAPQEGPDYISRYRDFKYEESLFELFARQYELARIDESREGALVQVVDVAQVPEWKSRPKRAVVALVTVMLVGMLLLGWVFVLAALRRARVQVESAARLDRLGAALRRAVGLRSREPAGRRQ